MECFFFFSTALAVFVPVKHFLSFYQYICKISKIPKTCCWMTCFDCSPEGMLCDQITVRGNLAPKPGRYLKISSLHVVKFLQEEKKKKPFINLDLLWTGHHHVHYALGQWFMSFWTGTNRETLLVFKYSYGWKEKMLRCPFSWDLECRLQTRPLDFSFFFLKSAALS